MHIDNNNNTNVAARESGNPTNADPPRVSARLLYHYVVNDPTPFAGWKDSLREVKVDLESVLMGYSVFEDHHDELTLNLKLATHLVMSASTFPKGAIAWVLLSEAVNSAERDEVDCIDRQLAKHRQVGVRPHLVQAVALHGFLGCETAFDNWFLGQEKSQRMVDGRDYIRIGGRNAGCSTIHQSDGGAREIFLGHEAAARLIMATPTHRGKLASSALLQRFG